MATRDEEMSPRELIREVGKLLRRSRKRLSDAKAKEIKKALDDASDARKRGDKEALEPLIAKLYGYAEGPLSAARKSKSRELFESVFVAVIIALCIRSFFFELFKIPSPSMVPTLLVGDRLVVEKFAYGIRLPFSTNYLVSWDEPERDEVVVFEFPRLYAQTRHAMGAGVAQLDQLPFEELPGSVQDFEPFRSTPGLRKDSWGNDFRYRADAGEYDLRSAGPDGEFDTADDITDEQVRASFLVPPGGFGNRTAVPCPIDEASLHQRSRTYIKRVIGEPGDTVELVDNTLVINGERREKLNVESRTERVRGGVMIAVYAEEQLEPAETHEIRYFRENRQFGPIRVPDGHYLMMGDNRDDSSDGRCWGFVPRDHVKGRATRIAFSTSESGDSSFFESITELFDRTGQKIR